MVEEPGEAQTNDGRGRRRGRLIALAGALLLSALVAGAGVALPHLPEAGERRESSSGGGRETGTASHDETTDERRTREASGERGATSAAELEAEVRRIEEKYPGEYGVVIWQSGSGTRVAVSAGESFSAASLAKLPVLLALYREAAEGSLSLEERIHIRPTDVRYGTGVLRKRPVGTGMTLRECAEYLIKESDNTAWAMLNRRLGEDRVRQEIESVGAGSTYYADARHTTTPHDTLKMLQKISDPDYTSPELSREMLSTMTDTAFEHRLTQGLPADARIYHKIGSLGDSFSDAGIVVPPEGEGSGEPYYVVVLSRDTGEMAARSAMQEISLAAYRGLVERDAEPRSGKPGIGSDERDEQVR